jgi:uncharacterized protein (TIGR02444 family)
VADSAFWRFSIRFYALAGVAPACLQLQDEGGADVNLLLFLLFLAQEGKTVSDADIVRLDSAVAAWREEAVMQLRRLRRRLKAGIGPTPPAESELFRTQIKKVELDSERLEQALLEATAAEFQFAIAPSRAQAARANLAAYSGFCKGLPAIPLEFVIEAFTNLPP